ncbi:MAG: MBL fold metallo-hydrolase [Myxococcales bacterium]|nr:MBL fold metallo-hydrolase [Myxococcales bacterium]
MIRPRQIAPDIAVFPARTPTLPPATHTNSYALGGRDVLLVEPATPYEDEQRAFIAWVRALAADGRRPVAIVLTHHHLDHVGGADVLARELGLPLWAHAETAARVSVPVARALSDGDELVLDGPAPARWRVLHTPGHAPGHVCLVEDGSRAAIVGDMVAAVGTILIAPGDGDMRIYLEQLERLAALELHLALPAHGDAVGAPSSLFRGYVAHRLRREQKVLAAVRRGGPQGTSAEDLVPTAYDDVAPAVRPIALLSLQSHLDKLVGDGRVRRTDGLRYSAVEVPA